MAKQISVVIPTLNEEGNIVPLVKRLARVFEERSLGGELLFIDDHSTDETRALIAKLTPEYAETFTISCHLKRGQRGKAQSLIEGFALAEFDTIVMIDADLQYPPEAIPGMLDRLTAGADIVVADRKEHDTNFLRKLLSKTFSLVFSRFLHDLHCDSQSGLKVFRKKILREVTLHPTPWTFDMEFLLSARNYGYIIDSVHITFAERQAGTSKLNPLRAMIEIGWSALRLKWQGHTPFIIEPETGDSMVGAGIAHNRQRFVTHTTLHHHISALRTFAPWQRNLIWAVVLTIGAGLIIRPLETGITVVAVLTIIYFIDAMFNLFLVMKSLKTPPELSSTVEELTAIDEATLPVYSVLCPLYKEAHMLPTFVSAMQGLDWPKNKLDVLLLLEENDPETIAAARAMDLPSYVRILVVPHSMPKTKPKACNYGLSFASGEYVVIYDAEDIPEPSQLKKAYLGFKNSDPSVRCLQAKLNYFNPHQNLLTRLFTAEYSLWFDVILPGLQSINTSIPLGGTSNHFRTADLLELEGWDPFNVTEDCDLGARIFKRGFRTAIIDSVTLEEANSDVKNWIRQRSRWIKGYMQTYLVHMRHPVAFVRENGWHALIFQLVVGGKIGFMFINPFLWLATVTYFTLYAIVGPTLEALFPPLVFYFAAISLVFGNFLYLYYYMIGTAKREHFQVVKYVFLVPFYWFLVSWAAFIGLYELIVKPHYWQKTLHGLHVKKAVAKKEGKEAVSVDSMNPHKVDYLESIKSICARFFPQIMVDFVFSGKGVLMIAFVSSNGINFLFNAFLGHVLSFGQLALVTLINTLWYIAGIFFGAFGSTVNHQTIFLGARKGHALANRFFVTVFQNGLITILVFAIAWVVAIPFLERFFQVSDDIVFFVFTAALIFGLITSSYQGYLLGNLRFAAVAVVNIVETITKMGLAITFFVLQWSDWMYAVIPLSLMASALVGWLFMPKRSALVKGLEKTEPAFPGKFFLSSILTSISAVVFLSADILLVKHFFAEETAGQYALLSLIGKMIYFLGSLPTVFMITLVSQKEGLRQGSRRILRYIFLSVLALVTIGVVMLGVFGPVVTPVLLGEKARAVAPWLLEYTFGIALFTLGNVIALYHLAKRHYLFSLVSIVGSLALTYGVWISHDSIGTVVDIVFLVSAGIFVSFATLHFLERQFPFLERGFRDFVGIFYNGFPKNEAVVATGKNILIFNWRDLKHLYAGGAELYAHEIAKVWVADGNQVTLFCGNDGREKRYETIDGVNIVRRGGFYLVYVWAFFYYMFRFRGKYDIIIDCENGIPFFAPLYVKEPVYCLMHHVHQEVFRRSLIKPLAMLAGFLEKGLMPIIYKNTKFITVSRSSELEMKALGLGSAGIEVVHPGVHLHELVRGEKSMAPTVLYLGRLKAYKSVDVLVRAFHMVVKERPDARLIIAGGGEEEDYLKRFTRDLGLSGERVQFLGKVDEKKKLQLLQSAWVLVNPSFMEGWGIVVIEANACGTPVIASDIPGLRDSVKNANTGYLVEYGDSKAFAENILRIIRDRSLREDMSNEARLWAENFSWEKSSKEFLMVINQAE